MLWQKGEWNSSSRKERIAPPITLPHLPFPIFCKQLQTLVAMMMSPCYAHCSPHNGWNVKNMKCCPRTVALQGTCTQKMREGNRTKRKKPLSWPCLYRCWDVPFGRRDEANAVASRPTAATTASASSIYRMDLWRSCKEAVLGLDCCYTLPCSNIYENQTTCWNEAFWGTERFFQAHSHRQEWYFVWPSGCLDRWEFRILHH